jgi:hypothetical protein
MIIGELTGAAISCATAHNTAKAAIHRPPHGKVAPSDLTSIGMPSLTGKHDGIRIELRAREVRCSEPSQNLNRPGF